MGDYPAAARTAQASILPTAFLCLSVLLALTGATVLLALPGSAVAAANKPLQCPEYKSLCLQADRSGGIDLKTGTAVLEGNVLGYIKEQNLSFSSDTVKAYRNKRNEWTRLVLDRQVRLSQPEAKASADHSVLQQERVLLFGNARAERPPYLIEADQIEMVEASGQITALGSKQAPARIVLKSTASGGTDEGGEDTIFIQAQKIELAEKRREMHLTGEAWVRQESSKWDLKGAAVRLELDENNQIKSFRAEGNAIIEQPGRVLRADLAISKNNNETILLIGNAQVVQEGEFQLSSDRLEVYTNAEKGVVQSNNRQQPIRLVFDVSSRPTTRLNRESLVALAAVGVPRHILAKLDPLLDRGYSGQEALGEAVRAVLTDEEQAGYLEAILAHAQ